MRLGGPKGSGWKEDVLPSGSTGRQWSHQGGAIRREFLDYALVTLPNGDRTYSGTDGGILFIDSAGVAKVERWNFGAVLGSHYGKGNRKEKLTISRGDRLPPQLPPQAGLVKAIRAYCNYPPGLSLDEEWQETWAPSNAKSKRAKQLLDVVSDEAYHLIRAVLLGEADELRRIADWLEISERIRTGQEGVPQCYMDIIKAVENAATEACGLPTRPAVEKAHELLVGINRSKDLRDDLGKMGLGFIRGAKRGKGKKRGGK